MISEVEPRDLSGSPSGPIHRQPRVKAIAETAQSRAAGQRWYEAVVDGWVFRITVEAAEQAALRERAARGATELGHHMGVAIRAQIPGRVVRIWVTAGEVVGAGQRLMAVEAMKMENEVRAPRAGVVGTLSVAIGQTVELGDDLIALE